MTKLNDIKAKEIIRILQDAIGKVDGEVTFYYGNTELYINSISAFSVIPDITIKLKRRK